MKKIIAVLFLFLPFYLSHAETLDEIVSTDVDYVNACEATYQLKMTYCRSIVVQTTTNCLRHSISLFPKKQRKVLGDMVKTKLNSMSVKTQAEVDKGFDKVLGENNQDKEKACQLYAEDLTNKRNDRYYEFRNALKAAFPSNKKSSE
jgi:hypothetical protein